MLREKCSVNDQMYIYIGMLGNRPPGFWGPFEHHLKNIEDSLGKAQRLLETLS
jgi:hypothetical protein